MISKTIGFRGLAYFQTNPNCPLSQALEFAFETATECGQIVSNCGRLWSIYTGGSGGVPLGHSLCEA